MVVRILQGADGCEYAEFDGESADVFRLHYAAASCRIDDADHNDDDSAACSCNTYGQ